MNPEESQVSPEDIPNQSQDPVPQAGGVSHDLTEDESASALGYITTIAQQHMMQQQAMEEQAAMEQEEASAPQEEAPAEATQEESAEEGSVLKEIKALREEVKGNDVQAEIEDIKAELQKLLKEDGTETKD